MLPPSLIALGKTLAQPRFARTACWGLLAIVCLAFLISLDRYPQSYIDEPYFNGPAANALHGKGFTFPVSAAAPHPERWCHHAPFYPHMQMVTFSVLGITEFACRVPQFLAAYLAVALLCEFLIRRGHCIAAIVLAIAWIGDRSSQEVLYGRMDGLALLFIVFGYVALVRVLERPTWRRALACGFSLGMAMGFHPVTAPFGFVAAILLAACTRSGDRLRMLVGLGAGGLVPLSLVLWAWSPNLGAALEQFQWTLGAASRTPLREKLTHVLAVLRWSRYWPLALLGAVALVLIPFVFVRLLRERRAFAADGQGMAWLAACAFALAGAVCLITPSVFPYYLVYFTIWPVVALVLTPTAGPRGRVLRLWFAVVSCAVVLCWIPSLAWNGLRLRESLLCRSQLDHAHFIEQLRKAIPKGTKLTGYPIFFMLAQEAGVEFTPVAWLPEKSPAAPAAWLLLSAEEWHHSKWISSASLEGRPVIAEADAFPGPGPFHLDYVILGPKPASGQVSP